MAAPLNAPLRNITRDTLEPLWSRMDIPTARIAAALGVSRQGLSWKAKALGLPPRTQNREPQKKLDDAMFTRMWLAGVSSTEMARYFGYAGSGALSRRRVILGLPARTRGRGGKNAGGWIETISLTQFLERDMADRLAARKAAA